MGQTLRERQLGINAHEYSYAIARIGLLLAALRDWETNQETSFVTDLEEIPQADRQNEVHEFVTDFLDDILGEMDVLSSSPETMFIYLSKLDSVEVPREIVIQFLFAIGEDVVGEVLAARENETRLEQLFQEVPSLTAIATVQLEHWAMLAESAIVAALKPALIELLGKIATLYEDVDDNDQAE